MGNNTTWSRTGKLERDILLTSVWVQLIIGTIENVIVVMTFTMRRQLRRRPSDLLICNLALVELFCCTTYLPWKIYSFTHKESVNVLELHFRINMFYFCLTNSFNAISAIGFDKFIAVVFPLQYVRKMTAGKTKLLMAFGWAVAILLHIIHLISHILYVSHSGYEIFLNAFELGQLALMSIFYVVIFKVARKHASNAAKHNLRNFRGHSNYLVAMKSVWNTLVVLCVFYVTVLPLLVLTFTTTNYVHWVRLSHYIFISSCVNPLIYFFSRQRYRRALFSILKREHLRESDGVA